jgi:hypothetical protein
MKTTTFEMRVHNRFVRFLIGIVLAVFFTIFAPVIALICLRWNILLEDLWGYISNWAEMLWQFWVWALVKNRWFRACPTEAPKSS